MCTEFWLGNFAGRDPFPKPVHRCVDTVEKYHKEKEWKDVQWIFLT
jgi:hypothetical protein